MSNRKELFYKQQLGKNMCDWKSIWGKKIIENVNLDRDEFDIFCDLKRADGFDVNVQNEEDYFRAFYCEWDNMNAEVCRLSNNAYHSVYEVGCGSGVNLFMFQNRTADKLKLGGIDYSSSLIDAAKSIIESDDLICGEAVDIDEEKKYDIVMADSVFQYFQDLLYAEKVLRKMISKANKVVYIGELHDKDLEEQWLENRRNLMENYDEIYKGLPKMFYSREWITDIAEQYNKHVIFSSSTNTEYWNSEYIFDCYIF